MWISDKILEGGTSSIFSISLDIATRFMEQIVHLILLASSDNVTRSDFTRYLKTAIELYMRFVLILILTAMMSITESIYT